MKKTTSVKSVSDPNALKGHLKRTANNNIGKTSGDKTHESVPLSHDRITALAYQLWCERGGSELENWLEAERRLKQQGYCE